MDASGGVVRHSLDQATEFGGRGYCENDGLVSSDVTDVVGHDLKLLLGNWCHRTCRMNRGDE